MYTVAAGRLPRIHTVHFSQDLRSKKVRVSNEEFILAQTKQQKFYSYTCNASACLPCEIKNLGDSGRKKRLKKDNSYFFLTECYQ